ncbi:MAG: dihydroorotase, partial [Planctomycetota bacterium]|nr:dihydroorotase [Planctomycetota bacterium]
MPTLVLKGGRVLDPSSKMDGIADVLIDMVGGRILDIGNSLGGDDVLDCRGLVVAPGFIDMHVHLREPGAKSKETIRSGAEAAVHGGFCAVVAMPNTDPPVDNEASVAFAYLQSDRAGLARVFPAGAITAGLKGEALAEMGLLARAGAVCFADDGRCVANAGLLRCALEYSTAFGRPIMEHCEDVMLSEGAVINEGPVSAVLGINGYPPVGEEIMVDRDVRLAEFTGGRLHVTHVSTAGSIRILRAAKARGVKVTCDVTPHHLLLTDEACLSFDPVFRVNPPLRSRRDTEELLTG